MQNYASILYAWIEHSRCYFSQHTKGMSRSGSKESLNDLNDSNLEKYDDASNQFEQKAQPIMNNQVQQSSTVQELLSDQLQDFESLERHITNINSLLQNKK